MPRTLFGRLFLHATAVLLVLLAVGAMVTDRYLTRWEEGRLRARLEAIARTVAVSLPAAPSEIQARVAEVSRTTGVRLTVVTPAGAVLADSHRDPARMEDHAGRPEIVAARQGRVGTSMRRSATLGEEMLYVAVPGDPVVRAALPLREVHQLLGEIRRRVLLAAVPAVLAALALAFLLSRGLTRRFEAMRRFAARTAAGDFDADLPVGGSDELADLERDLLALRNALRDEMVRLSRERERLEALIRHLPDGIVVLDSDHRMLRVNPAARRILRLAGPAEGLPGAEVLRHPDLLRALDACRGAAGEPPGPVALDWPDPPCRLLVRMVPLTDEAGRPGVLVVLRDVTRQHELERMRSDFIANLGHELRTPLTAIRGAAETLQDAALGDPGAARRFLDTIHRNALRLESLLEDVSHLARIEAGAAPLQPAPLDARDPVRSVVELFRTEAEGAGIDLRCEVPAGAVPLVSDADKIESVLVNLVQNAVRYTPEGGRVTASVEAAGGGAVFAVEDTGIGIPADEIPRVTERFYRVDPARSRATGGTGLGLSIVKHLVEILGGTLRIESRPGEGTRVTVTIPSL